MLVTQAAECGFNGEREMSWRHGLFVGNSGQPAILAEPVVAAGGAATGAPAVRLGAAVARLLAGRAADVLVR
jgi:hypothetical protein